MTKAHRTINIGLVVSCVVTLAMVASTANAASVTWRFQGNEYSGTGDDLAGEVTVTLDDEGTPGSVKVIADATGLPATATDSISFIYFNTVFDSDAGPFIQVTVQNDAGGSYKGKASNEDGFSAGNTIPDFDDGPLFDFRLAFNAPVDGAPFFDQSNDIFEATLTRDGLTVDDFLTLSAPNPNGQPGDPGPFQVSLRAVQLFPGAGGGFFSGTVVGPCPADLDGDRSVGFNDLTLLLGAWGTMCEGCPEDIDGDGSVGFNDLTILLGSWGPCE